MSTSDSIIEDVKYLMGKITFLDGQDLKSLCRDLDLPVTNMASGDMVEQLRDKIYPAMDSYAKMPSRETETILYKFRYNVFIKSKFLDRYLNKVRETKPE